jgi:hypothetical protein
MVDQHTSSTPGGLLKPIMPCMRNNNWWAGIMMLLNKPDEFEYGSYWLSNSWIFSRDSAGFSTGLRNFSRTGIKKN